MAKSSLQERPEDWRSARRCLEAELGPAHFGRYFVRTLSETLGEDDESLLFLALRCLFHLEMGHACLDLKAENWQENPGRGAMNLDDWPHELPALDVLEWSRRFAQSRIVGDCTSDRPFIFDGQRLYLRRLYQAQNVVASQIARRIRRSAHKPVFGHVPVPSLAAWREPLFPDLCPDEDPKTWDLQCTAASTALESGLTVITGGPGTGKTYTVVRLIALWLQAARRASGAQSLTSEPKVALLAPTGKAAGRLAESVVAAKRRLDLDPELLRCIPDEAQTIHRALGIGRRGRPRFHRLSPLSYDLVVVDELSMVDLELMAHLMDAMAESTSCVLLGDAQQLSSVGAGSVLAEICADTQHWSPAPAWRDYMRSTLGGGLQCSKKASSPDHARGIENEAKGPSRPAPGLKDVTIHLQLSRRYDPNSALAHFAQAILAGDFQRCRALLQDRECRDLQGLFAASSPPNDDGESIRREIHELCELSHRQYQPLLRAQDPGAAILAQEHFRILCATRHGPRGVEKINRLLSQRFARDQNRDPAWFRGLSINIKRNDASTGLYNGDLGVVFDPQSEAQASGERGAPRAYFSASGEELRCFFRGRLPDYEAAFALSIHKSQGSEFDGVLVILPPPPSPLLTRELLYTAVTRARKKLWLLASEASLQAALARRVHRHSGLGDAIEMDLQGGR